MKDLYILKLRPLFKEVVWGGSNLHKILKKETDQEALIGESWELCDLPGDQTMVSNGKFRGMPLGELLSLFPHKILGKSKLLEGYFPLLFKFIDAQDTLSVQVHPDEAACIRLGNTARPKTEAWYIIDAADESLLYIGLAPGTTREVFEKAIEQGCVDKYLNAQPVKKGDYIFIPAGTVHAIGAGILLAEVQQSSSTTYRIFDWNRMGLDNKPREMHIREALESINFDIQGPPASACPPSGRKGICCKYFCIETINLKKGESLEFNSDTPVVIMGVGGSGGNFVYAGDCVEKIEIGETLLIPACISDSIKIEGQGDLECVCTMVGKAD